MLVSSVRPCVPPPLERSNQCADRLTPARLATASTWSNRCDDAMPGSRPPRNGTPRPKRARCALAQPSPPATSLPGHPKVTCAACKALVAFGLEPPDLDG